MRTQKEVMQYIKEQDPETRITPNALRNMIISGKIPHVRVGSKYLIDIDMIDAYLDDLSLSESNTTHDSINMSLPNNYRPKQKSSSIKNPKKPSGYGTIRRISL